MLLEPLSKCFRCFSNVLLITIQPLTFEPVNYATLFCYVIFIFWCHQFIFQGLSTFKIYLYAIPLANNFKGDFPRQRNQVIDQLGPGERKETRKLQIEQSANENIQKSRENISKQGYGPQEPIILIYPNQVAKPIPKLPERVIQNDRQIDLELHLEINKDFEENSPYQEGIISEIYQRPDKSQIVDPPELIDLVNTERIVQKYLPKQTDIDKILKVIQRKVLKGTHLPLTIKEIQAEYLNSPYFKDLYLYLRINCQVQKVLFTK